MHCLHEHACSAYSDGETRERHCGRGGVKGTLCVCMCVCVCVRACVGLRVPVAAHLAVCCGWSLHWAVISTPKLGRNVGLGAEQPARKADSDPEPSCRRCCGNARTHGWGLSIPGNARKKDRAWACLALADASCLVVNRNHCSLLCLAPTEHLPGSGSALWSVPALPQPSQRLGSCLRVKRGDREPWGPPGVFVHGTGSFGMAQAALAWHWQLWHGTGSFGTSHLAGMGWQPSVLPCVPHGV
jgi:hypothetical protein